MDNYVRDLDLSDGESIRKACPKCGSKNTFTASKIDGRVVYNCYKLSCDLAGKFSSAMTHEELQSYFVQPLVETYSKNKELDSFVYPEHITNDDPANGHMRRFKQRWSKLQNETLLFDVKDKRAVFPIYSGNKLVDAIGRALDGAIPKWYRYSGIAKHYERTMGDTNGVYVIVEDVISAITVARSFINTTGYALLGTSLTEEHKTDIADNARAVIVALDPDALSKTLEYRRELQLWTGLPCKVLSLEDDLKYEREADMKGLKELIDYETGAQEQTEPNG